MRRRDVFARALAATFALVAAAAGVAAIAIALGLGDREPLEVKVARITSEASALAMPARDPLSWRASRRRDFEVRAAIGASHVVYEKSPGGVSASAERTIAYRDEIEAAAKRHGVDPDTLEAMIFLESAGRPDVIAGPTPESASGLGQIIPSTATDVLGMSVDLPTSIALTQQIASASTPEQAQRLRDARAAIDQRFDPAAAIEGAATYLEIARERFGADDLAVVSYHMGIGNLETAIQSFTGASQGTPIGEVVASAELSYAELFFDSGLSENARTYEFLAGLGDESSQYLWKVRASEEILDRYRTDPEGLDATAALATAKATLEEVFHPENETEVFDSPDEIEDAIDDGDLVPLPNEPALGWEPDRDIGELAKELDEEPALYRALRPEALATLTYLAELVRKESNAAAPLQLTSAVRDREYQELLVGVNPEATAEYSLHTTGWSFDIRRDYESKRQANAFQFVLDRLRSLALLDYAVEPGAIHVTVSNRARELLAD